VTDIAEQLERRHRRGYERFPVESHEFSVWEEEQVWGDETNGIVNNDFWKLVK
jgi:hypothetical protein